MVVYFIYNFLFRCLRASTNNRGDKYSRGVGHVDKEPRLARCHVLNSLSVICLQPSNNIHLLFFFIRVSVFFTCI